MKGLEYSIEVQTLSTDIIHQSQDIRTLNHRFGNVRILYPKYEEFLYFLKLCEAKHFNHFEHFRNMLHLKRFETDYTPNMRNPICFETVRIEMFQQF